MTYSPETYGIALRRLSRREHSSAEMATFLRQRGIEPSEVSAIIVSLIEQRLIDDERYARIMARYQSMRGKGPLYIRNRLRQKGVGLELSQIKKLLADSSEIQVVEYSERNQIIELIQSRYPHATTDRLEAARAYQAMLRRGFSPDAIRGALNDAAKSST